MKNRTQFEALSPVVEQGICDKQQSNPRLGKHEGEESERSRLMAAMDGINDRYGRNTMILASAGLAGTNRTWSMRQERRTPGYTTSWDDIAIARA